MRGLAVVAVMGALIAGCSPGDDGTPTSEADAATSTTVAEHVDEMAVDAFVAHLIDGFGPLAQGTWTSDGVAARSIVALAAADQQFATALAGVPRDVAAEVRAAVDTAVAVAGQARDCSLTPFDDDLTPPDCWDDVGISAERAWGPLDRALGRLARFSSLQSADIRAAILGE